MKQKPWSKVVKADPTQQREIVSYAMPKVSLPEGGDGAGGRLTPSEHEVLERDSFVRGFTEGEASARKLVEEEVAATTVTLAHLIEELTEMRYTLLKAAEVDVLKIAIAVSRRVLRHELSQNPDVVMTYIHEAMKKVGHTETVSIRVHPQHLERLTDERAKLIALIDGAKWLRFEPDLKLIPGECLIETPDRMLDARLDSQISIIEQKLNQARERE